MFKPIYVKAMPKYKLWLRYDDGVEGEVDLSDLAGKGVFSIWNEYSTFEDVHIGEHHEIAWSDSVDLCPDALYLRLTGRTPEEVFPNRREITIHA